MQRRTIRAVVGWRRDREESWEDTMRRMECRVQHAGRKHAWEPCDMCTFAEAMRTLCCTCIAARITGHYKLQDGLHTGTGMSDDQRYGGMITCAVTSS